MTRQHTSDAVGQMTTAPGTRLPPPIGVSLEGISLNTIAMPSLRAIVNREVTPDAHAHAVVVDALQRVKQWRNASMQERGDTIAGLLDFASAIGRFPPQRTEFPGFPGSPKRRQGRA